MRAEDRGREETDGGMQPRIIAEDAKRVLVAIPFEKEWLAEQRSLFGSLTDAADRREPDEG